MTEVQERFPVGSLVKHKPWFRGAYAGWTGRVRNVNELGLIAVDFDGDPYPDARQYEQHELVVVPQAEDRT